MEISSCIGEHCAAGARLNASGVKFPHKTHVYSVTSVVWTGTINAGTAGECLNDLLQYYTLPVVPDSRKLTQDFAF